MYINTEKDIKNNQFINNHNCIFFPAKPAIVPFLAALSSLLRLTADPCLSLFLNPPLNPPPCLFPNPPDPPCGLSL